MRRLRDENVTFVYAKESVMIQTIKHDPIGLDANCQKEAAGTHLA